MFFFKSEKKTKNTYSRTLVISACCGVWLICSAVWVDGQRSRDRVRCAICRGQCAQHCSHHLPHASIRSTRHAADLASAHDRRHRAFYCTLHTCMYHSSRLSIQSIVGITTILTRLLVTSQLQKYLKTYLFSGFSLSGVARICCEEGRETKRK